MILVGLGQEVGEGQSCSSAGHDQAPQTNEEKPVDSAAIVAHKHHQYYVPHLQDGIQHEMLSLVQSVFCRVTS